MKRILYVLICAACIPLTAFAQVDIVPFQQDDISTNAAMSVLTNEAIRSSFLEGVLFTVSNEAAVAVSGTTPKPAATGTFKLIGTFNSSNYYRSYDGTYTLRFATNATWTIYRTTNTEYTGPSWTNDDPTVMVATTYYPKANATSVLSVAALSASVKVSISAHNPYDGVNRIVFSNTAMTANGYWPVRVQAYAVNGAVTGVYSRIPIVAEQIICGLKNNASNVNAKVKVILNNQ